MHHTVNSIFWLVFLLSFLFCWITLKNKNEVFLGLGCPKSGFGVFFFYFSIFLPAVYNLFSYFSYTQCCLDVTKEEMRCVLFSFSGNKKKKTWSMNFLETCFYNFFWKQIIFPKEWKRSFVALENYFWKKNWN